MSQIYTDPSRESDPHALPDAEVFSAYWCELHSEIKDEDHLCEHPAVIRWFWWPCFPGCLPDGELNGPFMTEKEAIKDAQD